MPQVPSQTCPCVSWDVLETLKDMLYVLRILKDILYSCYTWSNASSPKSRCPCVSQDVLGTLKDILYMVKWLKSMSLRILRHPRDTQGLTAVHGQMPQVPSLCIPECPRDSQRHPV